MTSEVSIGIDLGTTNCCVAVYKDDKVEVIPNDCGNLTTPSYVAFTGIKERLIGDRAKNQAAFEPENTIFDVKRLIGRRFHDKEIQEDIKNWPFKIVIDENVPKVEISIMDRKNVYTPEDISSMILSKLKENAESYLNTRIKSCVITVPAAFNDAQRVATKMAGEIAGMRVLRIINEPTSAAIAYGINKKSENEEHVLIYDLGGGTFDVSILKIKGTNIKVLTTGGNTHLGGEDIDNRILEYAIEEFNKIHENLDLRKDSRALKRLRSACENAKRNLSAASKTRIEVESLIGEFDFSICLTRQKFEEMNEDLFTSTLEIVSKCLEDIKLNKSKIDQIVLIGGSTRIPKIKDMIKEFFDGKKLNHSINPDEAVAEGAAVFAAVLVKNNSKAIQDVVLSEVTSLSIASGHRFGATSIIIPKNTTIPVSICETTKPSKHFQNSIKIYICEGERPCIKDNHFLGKFVVSGFPPRLISETLFDKVFSIDENGILSVTCTERFSKITGSINICYNTERLTGDHVERVIKDASKCQIEDETFLAIVKEKKIISNYCNKTLETIISKDESSENELKIVERCYETLEWIKKPNLTKEMCIGKYDSIRKYCEKLRNT